ncbi:TPA: hypothetical protein RUX66_003214 [Aeromonas dhakensis]|uniref:hypothetical protein n=1 Tax=Aeromonas dhakensis TaxID=196024 RepID=UPI00036B50CB|nr:hypothetical protein [Aeromonas dhakensis]MBL0636118.1 hypothetical protein [Aeromonas dhakensis]HDZ8910414.1 hypothetical protein [Aeromonas dhakensis]
MFDNLSFKPITTTGRGSSELISITHSFKTKKNEILFRISHEVMEKCNFRYQDKVQILFANNNTVCRIMHSDKAGSVTLSQQSKKSETSPALVRLSFRPGLPDFLSKEGKAAHQTLNRVKYVHKEGKIDFQDGCVTFELELAEVEDDGEL